MAKDTSMTLTGPDGTTTGPFTYDDLEAAATGAPPDTAKAAEIIIAEGKCSTSFIQRRLGIGYNRAARIMEALEDLGVVTAADHVGKREIVATEVPQSLQLVAQVQKMAANPTRNTVQDIEVKEQAFGVAADELRSFVERMERLDAESKDIADAKKEVMAEAKMRGFDTKAIRKIVALRKRDKDDIAEEQAVLDLYMSALGM